MSLTDVLAKIDEYRDEPSREAVRGAAQALSMAWTQPSDATVLKANAALCKLANFPETRAMPLGDLPLALLAMARAHVADNPAEGDALCAVLINVYCNEANSRAGLRLALGSALVPASNPTLLRVALTVVRAILSSGAALELDTCRALLSARLLPLHQVQGKISPTESLLGQFHRELTLCVSEACKASPELCDFALLNVLERYPQMTEGNSPKEVLFLHEIEHLVQSAAKLSSKVRQSVVTRLAACAGSLHALVAERALCFWQNAPVIAKLQGDDALVDRQCSLILARASTAHWSATVRKMAGAALLVTTKQPVERDAVVVAAIAAAKAVPPPEPPEAPAPIPATFSSTSVVRDATEPFAHGAFGNVWRARATVAGKPKAQWPLLALKEMTDGAAAQREVQVMSRIGSHANIVALLGVFEGKLTTSIVLELAEGGDLHTAVVERGSLTPDVARFLAGEVGSALAHVHARGFVFGDVKPENVVLSAAGHAKLCDFGSCFDGNKAGPIKGTVEYLAPEQVASVPGDWWAFGCVVHFMLAGRPPVFFHDHDAEADLPAAFARAVTFADSDAAQVKDPAGRALVSALTKRDPAARANDGGESSAFFDGARPWSQLHLRTAPVLAAGAVAKEKGPWTRRTFSVLHSPMPGSWVGTGGPALPLDSVPKRRQLVDATQPGSARLVAAPPRGGGGAYNVLGIDLTAG